MSTIQKSSNVILQIVEFHFNNYLPQLVNFISKKIASLQSRFTNHYNMISKDNQGMKTHTHTHNYILYSIYINHTNTHTHYASTSVASLRNANQTLLQNR